MFLHTSIRTRNPEKSIGFYTKHLGMQVMSRREIPQNDAEVIFLQDPERRGATLELTYYRKQENFLQPDYDDRLFDHLAFEVKDMDATIFAMKEEGTTITDEPFRLGLGGSTLAFVEDPDGTLIELIQRG